jgi:hypothetical protein
MNYYASGGQTQGLKSLAQELPKYGRYGDDVVAHISSDEARMLRAMGGSGTINPNTGLPEYFFKGVSRAIAAPFKAINEGIKAIPVLGPAIDRGLVGLDKAVGNTIPGGWNTLAQTALSFTPLGLPAKVGLAALGGSGAFGPSGKFNFQKALISGAMAYGANQLTQGLSEAGGGSTYDPSTGLTNATAQTSATGSGDVFSGLAGSGGPTTEVAPGLFKAAQSNIDPGFLEGMSRADVAGANVLPSVSNAAAPSATRSFLSQTGENLASAGRGIVNLSGLGPQGAAGATTAATNFVKPVTTAGMTALAMGTMGAMQLDEQQKALDAQLSSGSIAQSEYDSQSARINEARSRAEQAVRDNPYQFAVGGTVSDEPGMDEARGLYQGNMTRGFMSGGMPTYNVALSEMPQPIVNNSPMSGIQQFVAGGNVSTPRFLSGGGDGMSDSIPATINGRQEARLADGEFVIPADVVSHLGNGSSKAGAKRLYSMMDKVRSARTGTKKQAPAVNTNRLMPA